MRRALPLLLAVLLAGCPSLPATSVLDGLQADFEQLQREERLCLTGSFDDERCPEPAEFDSRYRDIEQEAAAVARALRNRDDSGDEQVAIGLYRVAAFASLAAGSGNAALHADRGLQRCLALGGRAPPRDCALLRVAGQYEVLNAWTAGVVCLREDGIGCEPATLADAVRAFCPDVYDPLVEKTRAAREQPFLPEDVAAYLEAQLARAEATVNSLADTLTRGLRFSEFPPDACACLSGESDDGRCASLPPETVEAVCIIDHLAVTDGGCPPAIGRR